MLKFKVITLLACLSLLVPTSLKAGDSSEESKAMMQMLQGLKIDKKQVEGMLDMMAAQGKITKAQAAEAKKELAKKSDNDLEKLQQEAVNQLNSGASGQGLSDEHKNMVEEMKKRMNAGKSN